MKNKKGFTKFVAGATLGAGLALLFAPKTGKQTRKLLKEKFDLVLVKLEDINLEDVKENVIAKVEALKIELDELDKEKVLKVAKQKAKDLEKNVNELLTYAKAKGQPVLESAIEQLRAEAIVLTKEVLKKLKEKE